MDLVEDGWTVYAASATTEGVQVGGVEDMDMGVGGGGEG